MIEFNPLIFKPKPSFLSQKVAAKIVSSRMDHEGKTERRHKNPGSYQEKETLDVFYTYHRAYL